MIQLTQLRHAYPESYDFVINRKHGHEDYTFLHFFNPMELLYDDKIIETAPHSVIIFNKQTPQFFKSTGQMLHDWIHFSGDISDIAQRCGIQLDTLYYPDNPAFITDLIQELESEFYGSYPGKEQMIECKFQKLMLKLGRSVSGSAMPELAFETKAEFRRLREIMFASLNQKWSVPEMAAKVNLSVSRFYTVYKSLYGTAPMADLIKARISNAQNMLAYKTLRIEEIATLLGYENTTHFIRQFKSYTGCSPSAYRKQHREK